MNYLRQEVNNIVKALPKFGHINSVAYDTAWVARLGDVEQTRSAQALEWLRENQLENGSWGDGTVLYHHGRVVCTLAAMIALARVGKPADKKRWQQAQSALEVHISRLHEDLAGPTIGFELIVPTLWAEAESLGILKSSQNSILQKLIKKRKQKIAMLPKGQVNRFVTLAFSAEMAGTDEQDLLDIPNLPERIGSVGLSPAATAYYATHVRKGDLRALAYLHRYANESGFPPFAPFDIFEQGWVLWNLNLTDLIDDEMLTLWQPSLDWLEAAWYPETGVGYSTAFTPRDGDETAMLYEVLSKFDRPVSLEAVMYYEDKDCFRTYSLETHRSNSTNIHVLLALRSAGYPVYHPAIQKIFAFLKMTQHEQGFWTDKWHTSPYYVTSHIIIACANFRDDFAQKAVEWLLATQNKDGSWGYYMSTAEETAYALQALAIWQREGHQVPYQVIKQGRNWLMDHIDPPYPPIWIVKCLFSPTLIVRATIISALALTT